MNSMGGQSGATIISGTWSEAGLPREAVDNKPVLDPWSPKYRAFQKVRVVGGPADGGRCPVTYREARGSSSAMWSC